MKTKMSDLNNHLFAALERLNDDSLDPDGIRAEAQRAEAIVKLSDQVIGGHELNLKAARLYAEHGNMVLPMLPQIGHAAPGPKAPPEPGE